MSSAELSEWMAYERIAGPLGPARADIQAAIIAATVANANLAKGKRPFVPADFIPEWGGKRKLTPEELWAKIKQVNAALGGNFREGGGG